MAEGGYLMIDGSPEVKGLNYRSRSEVKELADYRRYIGVGDNAGAEGIDEDRYRLLNAYRVSQLDLALGRKTRGNDILGHMASRVRCGTVDLGGILAAECAAAVTGISAV